MIASILFAAAIATGDVRGIVVDESRKPVAGAHVYVYTAAPKSGNSPLCPYCYRDCGKHVPVDANSTFRIIALDSTLLFNLLAVADGYEPAFARGVDPLRGGDVTIELKRRSAADAGRLITGTVVDPNGKPVVGALVEPSGFRIGARVGYGNIPGLDQLSITDGKGAFALRMPSADGKLDVRVTARAYAPMIERMLAPGEPRTITVAEGAAVRGKLVRDGKPVAGARVGFVQRDRRSSNFLGRLDVGTNDAGEFLMLNLSPGEEWVVYTPGGPRLGGVAPATFVKTGAAKSTADAGTIVVTAGRRVAGRIIVPPGNVIPPRTRILLTTEAGGDAREAEVRGDGSFVFERAPREALQLVARIPGLKPAEPHALPAGGDVADARLLFECQQ